MNEEIKKMIPKMKKELELWIKYPERDFFDSIKGINNFFSKNTNNVAKIEKKNKKYEDDYLLLKLDYERKIIPFLKNMRNGMVPSRNKVIFFNDVLLEESSMILCLEEVILSDKEKIQKIFFNSSVNDFEIIKKNYEETMTNLMKNNNEFPKFDMKIMNKIDDKNRKSLLKKGKTFDKRSIFSFYYFTEKDGVVKRNKKQKKNIFYEKNKYIIEHLVSIRNIDSHQTTPLLSASKRLMASGKIEKPYKKYEKLLMIQICLNIIFMHFLEGELKKYIIQNNIF